VSHYVGAILAAGRGSRMGEWARRVPKPIMPVGDAPLIVHQIRAMKAVGIRQVFVVVGEWREKIRASVEDHELGVDITYVEQGEPLGSANAVGRLAPHIDASFVLLLGDYYVERSQEVLERMIRAAEAGEGSATLAKHESDATLLREACCIEVGEGGRIEEIVEKPLRPTTQLKGCGFYVLRPEFFDAVRRTPRTALRDEYELTVALDIFVQRQHRVYVVESDSPDTNFTRPSDVLQCNLEWLDRQRLPSYVGPGVELPASLRLDRCLIGAGAQVGDLQQMREVVVFPGASCRGIQRLQRAIVVQCDVVPIESSAR
jgi:NDP-sugar pyrophosphorylase family protein